MTRSNKYNYLLVIQQCNYKEVFQLAQDKGYKLYFGSNAPCQSNPEYYKEQTLCELTIIQKWLRDEHKIECFVNNFTGHYKPYYGILPALLNETYHTTYEDALLRGIYEALKLI